MHSMCWAGSSKAGVSPHMSVEVKKALLLADHRSG